MATLKILVTGGGSSGHISPALAIIGVLREMAREDGTPEPEFLWIGGRKGLEKDAAQRAGIPFTGIETGKLRRYVSWENFTDLLRIPIGIAQAERAVRKFAPDVLLSTGGYVAVPPVIAARLRGTPIFIHEQTVQIGLANRITARFATSIGVSFGSALDELSPRARHKAKVFGNPVRAEIFGGNAEAAVAFCGFDSQYDAPTIYVTGGSQGARILNRAVEEVLPELLQSFRVVHQCGHQPAGQEQDFERLQRAAGVLLPAAKNRYFLTPFVREEINHIFALADLVVGRAGAGTVAELCAVGKPAIYIPLVPTGGDEQTRNAQYASDNGAAEIIRQSDLNGALLLEKLHELTASPARLREMGEAARTLAKPNAARDIAREVLDLARKS